jgi:hypothetical protein
MRVPIRGGAAVEIATIADQEEALFVTPTGAIIAESRQDGTSGDIVRVPLDGGTATPLASSEGRTIGSLVTDGPNVYFADLQGVHGVAIEGGPPRRIAPRSGALALVGSNLIVATGTELLSVPLNGDPATQLATLPAGAVGTALDCGNDLCWTSGTGVAVDDECLYSFDVSRGLYCVDRSYAGGRPLIVCHLEFPLQRATLTTFRGRSASPERGLRCAAVFLPLSTIERPVSKTRAAARHRMSVEQTGRVVQGGNRAQVPMFAAHPAWRRG